MPQLATLRGERKEGVRHGFGVHRKIIPLALASSISAKVGKR